MTVIAADTKLEQVLGKAKIQVASEGEQFVLLRLANDEAKELQNYLDGLEAERILRETKAEDWIPFTELDKYRHEALLLGEVQEAE